MERRVFLAGLLPFVAACDSFDCGSRPEDGEDARRSAKECQSPTPEPTPVPPPVQPINIEFRVLGDIQFDFGFNGAEIQFGSTQEGTARLTSTLPWFSSTKTLRESLFLVLNASATGFGYMQVQIIVNGELFREASVSGFNPKLSVTGLFSK